MLRLLACGGAAAGALSAASCVSAPPETVSAQGCTPARQIYQPGVGGRPGSIINLPGNCPSPAQMRRAEAAAAAAAAVFGPEPGPPGPPDTRPVPPPLPSADVAIVNGVEKLCGWLYSGADYSLPAIQQTAFTAGYRRGSSANIVPLPEMRAQPSYSALGFTAVVADAPPEGHGVVAFASFHDPVCQVQVYGYPAEGERALQRLRSAGWTAVGGPTTPQANVQAQRYFGGPAGRRMTLVVNRWVGPTAAPSGLGLILNIVPGENRVRGEAG